MSRLVQSQPNPGPSATFYWLVVFDWSINNPTPFLIDVRDNFGDTIPDSWYTKKWPDEVRKQKVTFDLYPDKVFSVFAKVEKGNDLK